MKKRKKTAGSFIIRNKSKILFCLFIFAVFSLIFKGIMQMPAIHSNRQQISSLNQQIEDEKTRQLEIDKLSEKVNTNEYIEKMASEKLGLVKNNAKIFVDVSAKD